jgi:hypothetical protein
VLKYNKEAKGWLRRAAPEALLKWRLIGRGIGIHWEDLDEDISVQGLIYPEMNPKEIKGRSVKEK